LQISPIQEIKNDLLDKKHVRLFIKRDDLIHPSVSGNKWRKLKYNLLEAAALQQSTLLTFGGAFSNHIHAAAAAGKVFGFNTLGIIRGERILPLNPTLQFAEANDMQLHFISRSAYREKYTSSFQAQLKEQFGDFYQLPEGGTNDLALKGCAEIITELEEQVETLHCNVSTIPDYICIACGTGGTIAGMIKGSADKATQIIGFAALKGNFLTKEVELLLKKNKDLNVNWSINNDYHFGGYAKFKQELIEFINQFKKDYGIALDPIYTGKLLFGVFDLLRKDFFRKGSRIVAVHTGGLQGIAGFNARYNGVLR